MTAPAIRMCYRYRNIMASIFIVVPGCDSNFSFRIFTFRLSVRYNLLRVRAYDFNLRVFLRRRFEIKG